MITVCSFWFPRPDHEFWQDYTPFLRLLDKSVKRHGHRHIVITDSESEFESFRYDAPHNLMKATIGGQLEFLKQCEYPVVLVGADCMVQNNPAEVFNGKADILVTNRPPTFFQGRQMSPVNNGAVYLWNRETAVAMYERANAVCEEWWGADQQAVSDAVSPVPDHHGVAERHGAKVIFAPCEKYNATPDDWQKCDAYVVHFKGPRKDRMQPYFDRYIRCP